MIELPNLGEHEFGSHDRLLNSPVNRSIGFTKEPNVDYMSQHSIEGSSMILGKSRVGQTQNPERGNAVFLAQPALLESANAESLPQDFTTSPSPPQRCLCMACLLVGVPGAWTDSTFCRFPGCSYTTFAYDDYISHERDHYHKSVNPLFHCVEQHCKFTTKRWPDLIRHYTVKHCVSPRKFPCPVPWCKYNNDGFPRKDKLTTHYKNVHQGYSAPRKAMRVIKPAKPSAK